MEQIVFYSWQSGLPNALNRGFIMEALEGAAKELAKDEELAIEPVIDRDTANVPGSPDIGQTIFAKIDRSAVFVCDVSIVNQARGEADRPTPNPNVLVELGYALKALGWERVIMVMNTAFGGVDQLPFDLKQKRTVLYSLAEGQSDKAAIRKELRGKLVANIRGVIQANVRDGAAAAERSLLTTAVGAMRESRPDQKRAVSAFMKSVGGRIKGLDPHNAGDDSDEGLVQAIAASTPLVREFDQLAAEVGSTDARDATRSLYKGFEHILGLYFPPDGVPGSYRSTDFDFPKFIGHELFVLFAGHLLQNERFTTLDDCLTEHLYVPNGRRDDHLYSFRDLSKHIALLDTTRAERLATGGIRRVSIHADLLKSRYDNSERLSGEIDWSAFMDADLVLFFRSRLTLPGPDGHWWPRSSVFLSRHDPRFLLEARSPSGARRLAQIMGSEPTKQFKEGMETALKALNRGIFQMDQSDGINFDPSSIAIQ